MEKKKTLSGTYINFGLLMIFSGSDSSSSSSSESDSDIEREENLASVIFMQVCYI